MILSALNSRMERQGGLITKAEVYEFVFATQEDVEVFLALAKNVDSISFQKLVLILLIISLLIFLIISYQIHLSIPKVGRHRSHW